MARVNRGVAYELGQVLEHVALGRLVPLVDDSTDLDVLQQIVNKTDGVPLFVEELTKMVLESSMLRADNGHYELTGPLQSLAIPITLQDSLMARLDRLPEVGEVVQLAAVLARIIHRPVNEKATDTLRICY